MECPFCNIQKDRILHETEHTLITPSRFPATRYHLLVIPKIHKGIISDLDAIHSADLMKCIQMAIETVKSVIHPKGINTLYNIGKAAGQSVPGHIHVHIISRYNEDEYGDEILIGRRKELLANVSVFEMLRLRLLNVIGLNDKNRRQISEDELLFLRNMFLSQVTMRGEENTV